MTGGHKNEKTDKSRRRCGKETGGKGAEILGKQHHLLICLSAEGTRRTEKIQ